MTWWLMWQLALQEGGESPDVQHLLISMVQILLLQQISRYQHHVTKQGCDKVAWASESQLRPEHHWRDQKKRNNICKGMEGWWLAGYCRAEDEIVEHSRILWGLPGDRPPHISTPLLPPSPSLPTISSTAPHLLHSPHPNLLPVEKL